MRHRLSYPALRLALVCLTAALTSGCASDETDDDGGLEISRALIAEPVLGERAAMYFTVRNTGDADDALLAVSTPAAGRAELHRTVRVEGAVRMERVANLTVPAGGELRLAPGDYHIMLLDLAEDFSAGDSVPVKLIFQSAGGRDLVATVLHYADLESALNSAGHQPEGR